MSRKRARRSNTASLIDASEDASTLKRQENITLQLPTELIYTILAISMGDYLGDMMLYPSMIQKWDATLTLLQVSRTFRGCTIDLLYHLWGDTFIHERTSQKLQTYLLHLSRAFPRSPQRASHIHLQRCQTKTPLRARRATSHISPAVFGQRLSATRQLPIPFFMRPKTTACTSSLTMCTREMTFK
ncbi:hypothetical protein BGW80DRAFT_844904 [Lactifluus volemus]|nr:hypothetical protein BGW80DRAFT_844904 [Lactifluus volemus]